MLVSQADLDAIIGNQLAQELAKYSDYETLKTKAAKLDELEEANKSELEKLQAKLTKATNSGDFSGFIRPEQTLHGTTSPFGADQHPAATTKSVALGTVAADKGGTFADLNSGLSLYFQVKMKENSEEISHAYPVVGEEVTVYNLRKKESTQAIFRPGIFREELKRVNR